MDIRRQQGAPPTHAVTVSALIGSVEFVCEPCGRHGCYRADRLLEMFGDLGMPELRLAVATQGKCHRALNPPTPASSFYGKDECKIRIVDAKG